MNNTFSARYRRAAELLPFRADFEERVLERASAGEKPRRLSPSARIPVKIRRAAEIAGLAACLVLAVLCISTLFRGGAVKLPHSTGSVSVRVVGNPDLPVRVPMTWEEAEEQALFDEADAVFSGRVQKLETLELDVGGELTYRSRVTVLVDRTWKGEAAAGEMVSLLLPYAVHGESGETEIINRLSEGTKALFLAQTHTEEDVLSNDKGTLALMDTAAYGLKDDRYLILRGAEGEAVLCPGAYPSLPERSSYAEAEALADRLTRQKLTVATISASASATTTSTAAGAVEETKNITTVSSTSMSTKPATTTSPPTNSPSKPLASDKMNGIALGNWKLTNYLFFQDDCLIDGQTRTKSSFDYTNSEPFLNEFYDYCRIQYLNGRYIFFARHETTSAFGIYSVKPDGSDLQEDEGLLSDDDGYAIYGDYVYRFYSGYGVENKIYIRRIRVFPTMGESYEDVTTLYGYAHRGPMYMEGDFLYTTFVDNDANNEERLSIGRIDMRDYSFKIVPTKNMDGTFIPYDGWFYYHAYEQPIHIPGYPQPGYNQFRRMRYDGTEDQLLWEDKEITSAMNGERWSLFEGKLVCIWKNQLITVNIDGSNRQSYSCPCDSYVRLCGYAEGWLYFEERGPYGTDNPLIQRIHLDGSDRQSFSHPMW